MQCCICLREEAVNAVQLPCCKNSFCQKCLNEWKQVRNVCPLCSFKLGEQQINTLSQVPQQFDNGFIMLQQQIKDIESRIKYAEQRISKRRNQSKNFKSSFSASHIIFLEDQLQLVSQYKILMFESFNGHDRGASEIVLSVEAALESGSIKSLQFEEDNEMNDYYEQDYDDYYDSEQQYEKHETHLMKKQAFKQKKANKTVQNQKIKAIKNN